MISLPSPSPTLAQPALNSAQKAAVIVRMLEATGVALPPGTFSPEQEAEIARQMDGLKGMNPAILGGVVDEFLSAVGGTLPPPPGPPAGLLPAAPGLPELPDLPIMSAQPSPGDPSGVAPDPWDRVRALDTDKLLAALQAEAPEVGGVIMSKLKVSRAAELLGLLPGPRARRIAYAVSQIAAIRPETVLRIGHALCDSLTGEAPRAFADGPVERVGAILNHSRAATRNDVLDGLEDTDPDFAEAVRRSIFTFANIPQRVGPRDVPKIIRQIDQPILVTALAAARGAEDLSAAADFLLGSMSQRMAEALRGEVEELAEVKEADGEAAMTAVVAEIRALEEAGEIYLIAGED